MKPGRRRRIADAVRMPSASSRARVRRARPLTLRLPASALCKHRLRDRVRIRLEAGDYLPRNGALDEALDIAQEYMFVDAHQRDRLTVGARTPRAADAMDVVAGDVGKIVVDDMRQL